eukprot:jgi/Picre1/34659/NNA_002127.t1
MGPNKGGAPAGDLAAAIDRDFGSFDAFKDAFKAAGATQFGSGWAWLCVIEGEGEAYEDDEMYSLRKGVHIDDVSSEMGVWAGLPSSSSSSSLVVDSEDSGHGDCVFFLKRIHG